MVKQSRVRRRGFTLVELLVVVVIIGMLVGLLLPAVLAARSAAYRSTCTNRQRELAQAVIVYATAKDRFPGSLNQQQKIGWPIVLLPYLDREDLWVEWRDGDGPVVKLAPLTCPNDAAAASQAAPLSYVGNPTIFRNRSGATPPVKSTVRLTDVKSPSNTILLSERVGAGPWTAKTAAPFLFAWNKVCDAQGQNCITTVDLSSNHAGSYLVAFCDGHVDMLADNTDWNAYPPGPP